MPWIKTTDRLPNPETNRRVLIFTEGLDFAGRQVFDVDAESLNECSFVNEADQPEECSAATHWQPIVDPATEEKILKGERDKQLRDDFLAVIDPYVKLKAKIIEAAIPVSFSINRKTLEPVCVYSKKVQDQLDQCDKYISEIAASYIKDGMPSATNDEIHEPTKSNRPPNPPTCKHGRAIGYGCKECGTGRPVA